MNVLCNILCLFFSNYDDVSQFGLLIIFIIRFKRSWKVCAFFLTAPHFRSRWTDRKRKRIVMNQISQH